LCQSAAIRVVTHHISWKNWQILLLKLILIAGTLNFLAIIKILGSLNSTSNDPSFQEFMQKYVIYVLAQSAYFAKIFESVNKMRPDVGKFMGKISPKL
jgi:hypothetical protein